ncbi:hypothetical protein ACH5RR_029383 [Cinchona calisaya]|uniref:Uncharacterized protein n=1 Tax=Cinchona calisaya TaxID=153742 RepID=A0ABD2YRH9_9GENT
MVFGWIVRMEFMSSEGKPRSSCDTLLFGACKCVASSDINIINNKKHGAGHVRINTGVKGSSNVDSTEVRNGCPSSPATELEREVTSLTRSAIA